MQTFYEKICVERSADMRYGSVCSGIEAASVAWKPLGWECAFLAETARFQSKLLAERYPGVPNLGDFTKIQEGDYEGDIELLVGGTPCPSFSIAGLRRGLEDARGDLALEFARLAFRTRARWLVWENVPGVLSSRKGGDFAAFLSLLTGWEVPVPKRKWKCAGLVTAAPGGFSVGWRILDAQYTRVQQFPRAVPQRRRRLIVVGYLGDCERVARVLFGGEVCKGDSPPCRGARRKTPGGDRVCLPLDLTNLDGRLNHLPGKGYDADMTAAYTITRRRPSGVCTGGVVRFLTPLECERAFGLPDGYTAIPYHARDVAPRWSRYRALGNSMCVNVMRWVGERIETYGREDSRGNDRKNADTTEGSGG